MTEDLLTPDEFGQALRAAQAMTVCFCFLDHDPWYGIVERWLTDSTTDDARKHLRAWLSEPEDST